MSLWSELVLAEHVIVQQAAACTLDECAAALLLVRDIAPEVQGHLLVRAIDGLGEPIAAVIHDPAGVSHIICAWNRLGDRADQARLLAAVEHAAGTEALLRVKMHQPSLGSQRMMAWLAEHGYVQAAGGVWTLPAQEDDLEVCVLRYAAASCQHTALAA